MRVLQLLKTSHGAEWAVRQMRDLVRAGVEVHAALPPGGPQVELCRAAGIKTHLYDLDFPVRRPWRWRRVWGTLRSLIREISPALVHSHFVGTTLSMRLALGQDHPLPRIFQVAGPLHLEHALFRNAEIVSAGRNDYWIATCLKTRGYYLNNGINALQVFLSYYGFDVEKYSGIDPGDLRARLGIKEGERIVGMMAMMYRPKWYLGQRQGIKGHEDLIEALALCLKRRKDLKGLFVGGAFGKKAEPYERKLRAYAQKCCGDAALFLGTRKDVKELYALMDVAVHPSHSENLGGAVESLLMNVPTIATNLGGFPDLITPGQTGWLVPAHDPPRLAEAILEVLDNLPQAKEMAARGRARVVELCSPGRTSAEVLQIYSKILARPCNSGS